MRRESSFELGIGCAGRLACRWSRPSTASAATVVYVHGFGSSQAGEKAEYFRSSCLAAGFGFFSLDLRGHGASSGGMGGLSLSRCLEDLATAAAFLDDKARPLVLLGSSLGGLVGLWHAALAPRGIVAGLYMAPAVGLAESFAELLGEEGMRRWREEGTVDVVNELGTFEVGWGFSADLEDYPTTRLAQLHQVPSLLFQGRLDERVDWRRVSAFCEAARGAARLRLYPRGDHRLLEHRDEMWAEMRRFLATRLTEAD